MTFLRSNSTTFWSLKESPQEIQRQPRTLRKKLKREAKIVDLGRQKAGARKAENVLSNKTRHRKCRAKELDQEGP